MNLRHQVFKENNELCCELMITLFTYSTKEGLSLSNVSNVRADHKFLEGRQFVILRINK